MSLLNPALIFGLAFVLVPIVLHLLMRSKPKRLIFPALRLIQQRRMQNVRRIRLRHLWLLLLRMLVLAVLAVALTRPSLPAANYSLTLSEALRLGGIVVVLGGVYAGVVHHWRKQRLANHTLASRRSMLRGGVGVAGLLLFAALVAWPYQRRVGAEVTAPAPPVSADVPVAAVFLFDTSLSMDYRHESRTRLEAAQEIATNHLESLPSSSRVAIAHTGEDSPVLFQADMAGANERIDSVQVSAAARPLNERLRSALSLHDEDRRRTLEALGLPATNEDGEENSDQLVREIYVFTDLAQSAWQASSGRYLKEELQRMPWVSVYLIDVSVEQPRNVSLSNLKLSVESVTGETDVVIEASVAADVAGGKPVSIELAVQNDQGSLVKQGQQAVSLNNAGAHSVRFSARVPGGAITQGELKLLTSDPLEADNSLRFTVGIRPEVRILVVAPAGGSAEADIVASDANELVASLQVLGHAPTFLPSDQLASADLKAVDLVFLINVPAPSPESWKQLGQFVKDGGGLMLFLGSAEFAERAGIRSAAWAVPEATALLPAELKTPRSARPTVGLDIKDTTHPVLSRFEGPGIAAEIALIPVYRYWITESAADSRVLATFTGTDNTPALLERSVGKGRVLMLATGGNLEFDQQHQWSRLAGEVPFLILIDQAVQHLSNQGRARFNIVAGEPLLIDVPASPAATRWLLRKPSGVQLPLEGKAAATAISVLETDLLGQYGLRAQEGDFSTGFSVNPDAAESDFTRLTEADLNNLLGEERYAVAKDVDGLTRSVNTGRLGVEVFPIVLALVVLAFCLELTVANRFYEADQHPSALAVPR